VLVREPPNTFSFHLFALLHRGSLIGVCFYLTQFVAASFPIESADIDLSPLVLFVDFNVPLIVLFFNLQAECPPCRVFFFSSKESTFFFDALVLPSLSVEFDKESVLQCNDTLLFLFWVIR